MQASPAAFNPTPCHPEHERAAKSIYPHLLGLGTHSISLTVKSLLRKNQFQRPVENKGHAGSRGRPPTDTLLPQNYSRREPPASPGGQSQQAMLPSDLRVGSPSMARGPGRRNQDISVCVALGSEASNCPCGSHSSSPAYDHDPGQGHSQSTVHLKCDGGAE